jgi:hypothetical protein
VMRRGLWCWRLLDERLVFCLARIWSQNQGRADWVRHYTGILMMVGGLR